MLEFQNTKTSLLKDTLKIGQKKEVFLVTEIKNTILWTYVKSEPITGSFYEKELQKTIQNEFRIENVLKRNDDKLYGKWKRFDNSFNSLIDKKECNCILSNAVSLYE